MTRRILMLVGDHDEDCEILVPFQALQMVGYLVDTVSPGMRAGDEIRTDVEGAELGYKSNSKSGHRFALNATFDEVRAERYHALVIPGGRAPQYLRLNQKVQDLVKRFAQEDKPIAALGNGPQVLAAAGVIKGRVISADAALVPELQAAGAEYASIHEDEAVVDGNLVTAPGWRAQPEWLAKFLKVMHAEITIEEPPLVTA